MNNRIESKLLAKEQLKHSVFSKEWCYGVLVILLIGLVTGFIGSIGGFFRIDFENFDIKSVIGIILAFVSLAVAILITPALSYGETKTFKDFTNGKVEEPDVVTTFSEGFSKPNYVRVMLTNLLSAVYIFLWSLLLIIPGIVKSYAYSMVNYLMEEDVSLKYDEAITKSREKMYGHKMELFVLDLSYIGWYIVGILCLGIGVLWVRTYHQTAKINFFKRISK